MVRQPDLKDFLRVFNYQMPSEETIKTTIFSQQTTMKALVTPRLLSIAYFQLKKYLATCDYVSLSADGWSKRHGDGYFGLMAQVMPKSVRSDMPPEERSDLLPQELTEEDRKVKRCANVVSFCLEVSPYLCLARCSGRCQIVSECGIHCKGGCSYSQRIWPCGTGLKRPDGILLPKNRLLYDRHHCCHA